MKYYVTDEDGDYGHNVEADHYTAAAESWARKTWRLIGGSSEVVCLVQDLAGWVWRVTVTIVAEPRFEASAYALQSRP